MPRSSMPRSIGLQTRIAEHEGQQAGDVARVVDAAVLRAGETQAGCADRAGQAVRFRTLLAFAEQAFDVAVRRGDRVAQIVFARVATAAWDEVSGLSVTERGAGGFGSTGTT